VNGLELYYLDGDFVIAFLSSRMLRSLSNICIHFTFNVTLYLLRFSVSGLAFLSTNFPTMLPHISHITTNYASSH
jgi:hypothetical protein